MGLSKKELIERFSLICNHTTCPSCGALTKNLVDKTGYKCPACSISFTVEEINSVAIYKDQYHNANPIKQLGFKYNTNTNGYMPHNVDLAQVQRDAKKLNLTVHKAASGNWFFKDHKGRFINPHRFNQLESKSHELPQKELTEKYRQITKQYKDLQAKFRHFEVADHNKYDIVILYHLNCIPHPLRVLFYRDFIDSKRFGQCTRKKSLKW